MSIRLCGALLEEYAHFIEGKKRYCLLTSSPDLCQNNRGLFEQRPHLNIISLNKNNVQNMKESLELDLNSS